jgi:BlaI family transcriptional regulator, penicillinase repressor
MTVSFTDRELDVMAVLWERGPSTVAEVREALEDDLAYTTVLTVLRTLEDKGYAAHGEAGRAYRYYAAVEREAAGESALRRMLGKLFGGSPELLLTQLVRERGVDPDALRRMREMLDARLGDGAGAADAVPAAPPAPPASKRAPRRGRG